MRYKSKSYYEGLLRDPNVQRALSVIRQAEHSRNTKDPYRTAVTNKPINDLSWHPGKAYKFNKKGDKSTASGAYQFLKGTWNEIAKAVGIEDFTPRSQDIAAVARIDWRGGLDNVLAADFDGFVNAVKNEWASFPGGKYNQSKRSWSFMNRAWREAGPTAEAAAEAGLYDTIFGKHSPTPNENTNQMTPGLMNAMFGHPARALGPAAPQTVDPSTSEGGLYMQRASAPQAGNFGVPAYPGTPVPAPAPTRTIGNKPPVSMTPPTDIGLGMQPPNMLRAPQIAAPAPVNVNPPTTFGLGMQPTQSPHFGAPAPTQGLETPPAEYQQPAFSGAVPKVDAFQHAPVPGLQRSDAPDGFGFDAVPAIHFGNLEGSTAAKMDRGLAPIAAGGHGAAPRVPGAGPVTSALMSRAEKSDPGYFPAAPKTGGGLLGNMFGLVPATGKTSSVSDLIRTWLISSQMRKPRRISPRMQKK